MAAILKAFPGQSGDLQRHLNNLSDDLRQSLANDGADGDVSTETSNIDDAPPLPLECKNKVINENCGLIPRHYKPFEHIHEENGVQLFKCNYCAQVNIKNNCVRF